MYNQTTTSYDNLVSRCSDFLDRSIDFFDVGTGTKIIRVTKQIVTVAAGLVLFGGLFRLLAWTASGWNQFSTVLRK